jgi:hypothetical protein
MIPPIIGIVGRSRAGKDSIAETIISVYPQYEIQRLSMPLKKAVCVLYDFEKEQLENNSKEVIDARWNKTPRETIQSMTDYMMSYMGIDFFTKKLYYNYDNNLISKFMIIPDIRYMHDIIEVQKRGGIIIKVERPNLFVNHTFENHVDELVGDFTICNNGSIVDLQNQVSNIIMSIKS